jgi:hypothetical protein
MSIVGSDEKVQDLYSIRDTAQRLTGRPDRLSLKESQSKLHVSRRSGDYSGCVQLFREVRRTELLDSPSISKREASKRDFATRHGKCIIVSGRNLEHPAGIPESVV